MLGQNAASQMSITVRALRSLGVSADGLVWGTNAIVSDDGLRNLNHGLKLWARVRRGIVKTSSSYAFSSSILRADVIHWNYGLPAWGRGLDVKLARMLHRPGVVEFWGSDVRISEIAEQDNPYYVLRGADYEYERQETREGSSSRQELFARNGVRVCLAPPWFDRYIKPGLFAEVRESFARLMLDDFSPNVSQRSAVPVILHAPSARGAKGTEIVIQTIARLRERFEFEFFLLHKMPRGQVLEAMRNCDLFLDQFVLGEYGMASLEAMAFAKPAVCYVRQDVIDRSPGRLPIVNATPDTLYDSVAELLSDHLLRRRIGEESRRYIETYHDARKHAESLVHLYRRVIGREE